MSIDDEREEVAADLRQAERYRRTRRNRLSCRDGFCGADDCERCRPGCTKEIERAEPDSEED